MAAPSCKRIGRSDACGGTGLHLAAPGCTGLHLAALGCTWLHLAALGCTGNVI